MPSTTCRVQKHGEHAAECAQSYLEYGQALLRKVQLQDDPFGSRLPGRGGEQSAAGTDRPSTSKEDERTACDAGEGEASVNDADEAVDEAEGEGEGEGEESDDLELSFQVLEVARLIYQKMPAAEGEASLAEVLELIGEVQMENEAWEDAIKDLKASLEIKERRLPAGDRQLAHMHYQIATATVSLVEKQRAQAREHYQAAADVLQQRLNALPTGASTEAEGQSEEKELRELLAEVRAKVEEQSAQSQGAQSQGAQPPNAQTATSTGAPPQPTPDAEAGAVTTIGFGGAATQSASTAAALPVQSLSVVKKKKAVLEPLNQNPSGGPLAEPSSKKARVQEG